jgi:hypothetical protein
MPLNIPRHGIVDRKNAEAAAQQAIADVTK